MLVGIGVNVKVGGRYGVGEAVAVKVPVAVAVGVFVKVEVGVLVRVSGVKLKVGDRGVSVRLGVVVSDGLAVGVAVPGLIMTATVPRQ